MALWRAKQGGANQVPCIVLDNEERREMTILKTIILGTILGMRASPSHSHAFLSSLWSPTTGGSVSPPVGVDPGGSIDLIWKEARDSQSGHIFFNRSTEQEQSWQQEAYGLDRETPDWSRSSSPRLDSDGQGNVSAVWWTKHRDGTKDIRFNTSKNFGSSCGPTVKLNRDYGAFPPAVSVSWFNTRDGGGSVYFRASDDFGRTWREEVRMKGGDGDVEGPMEMAADDQGHLYVAWADNREGEYGIDLVASTDHGGKWFKEVRLEVAKAKISHASLPTLAADPSGHVSVAWQDARHSGWDIYLTMSSDFGNTWHTEGARLNTGPAGEAEARLSQMVRDGHGTIAVV
jgi:hypothetical protein